MTCRFFSDVTQAPIHLSNRATSLRALRRRVFLSPLPSLVSRTRERVVDRRWPYTDVFFHFFQDHFLIFTFVRKLPFLTPLPLFDCSAPKGP